MEDKVEPRCDVCRDVGRMSSKYPIGSIGSIETLRISGEQGCLICSMIYCGIKKSEIEILRTHKDENLRWKYFATEVRNFNTLQVKVGAVPDTFINQLDFYIDSCVYCTWHVCYIL